MTRFAARDRDLQEEHCHREERRLLVQAHAKKLWEEGLNTSLIARRVGLSEYAVRQFLKAWGVKANPRSEQ